MQGLQGKDEGPRDSGQACCDELWHDGPGWLVKMKLNVAGA